MVSLIAISNKMICWTYAILSNPAISRVRIMVETQKERTRKTLFYKCQ